jgi:hypothetical protein
MAAAEKKIRIATMRQMEKALAGAVAKFSGDPQRMQLAALNPIFAMEEAGFEFPADLRGSIERRVRFVPDIYVRMEKLAGEINTIAGRPVDPDSAADIDRLLFFDLKLVRPKTASPEKRGPAQSAAVPALPTERLLPRFKWMPEITDPLETLRGAHPVMVPLLEYRRYDASAPRLATPELYDKVRKGEVKLPIKGLRVTIRPHPPGH